MILFLTLILFPPPRGHVGDLVASWCIFILITALLGHINTATTKQLDFKKSHLTSGESANSAFEQSSLLTLNRALKLLPEQSPRTRLHLMPH
jgi:hypothetical protein